MKWMIAVYLIGCYLLFSFFFLFFNGYKFEGMPLGTYLGLRDISGMDYKQIREISRKSLNQFESLIFIVNLESEKFQLEHGTDFYLKVDSKTLLSQYRRFRDMVPWYQRAMEFISLKFGKRVFPVPFILDREQTEKSLRRRFSRGREVTHRVEGEFLLQIRWAFDFNTLLGDMDQSIKTVSSGLVPLELKPIKQRDLVAQEKFFQNQVSTESIAVEPSQRVFRHLSKILDSRKTILLNPGDEFSFLDFLDEVSVPVSEIVSTAILALDLTTASLRASEMTTIGVLPTEVLSSSAGKLRTSSPRVEFDGVPFEDYHGLSMLSSLMFRTFLKLGFQILRHSHHPHYFPGVPYFQPGLDAMVGQAHDLKVLNSTRQPFLFVMSLEPEKFSLKAFACLPDFPSVWLKEAYRNIEYADMITLLDLALEKGEKTIVRKPISGLAVGTYRLWRDDKGRIHRRLVWKSHYESMKGIIHVGEEGMNVFNPENWKELGLDGSYTLRDTD